MSKIDFSPVNKETSNSFHKQKKLIKKVLAGKSVACEVCKQPLFLVPKNKEGQAYIQCKKTCTHIELEVEN
jgi:hypothetical protein